MRKIIFIIIAFFSLLFITQCNKTEDNSFGITGIDGSDYLYFVEEGNLHQYKKFPYFADVEKTDTLFTDWKHYKTFNIPSMKMMEFFDIVLTVEQNHPHYTGYYDYILYKEDSVDFLYRHTTARVMKGRFTWDMKTQSPILDTVVVAPVEFKPVTDTLLFGIVVTRLKPKAEDVQTGSYVRQKRVGAHIIFGVIVFTFMGIFLRYTIFPLTRK